MQDTIVPSILSRIPHTQIPPLLHPKKALGFQQYPTTLPEQCAASVSPEIIDNKYKFG
jgi:hypothetical protein